MASKKIQIMIAAGLITTAVIVYFLFSPEESGSFFPPCPFHYVTGLDCPGCGSQRAIHHLLHLDFKMAFLRNPLLVMALPYILLGIYFEYFGGKVKYTKLRDILFGRKASIVIFIVVVVYWIGRNAIKYFL